MKPILEMDKEELLVLPPHEVVESLRPEEFVHIASTLGAYWQYDYVAAKEGRVGMHAILKSERHSDGFFVSKIILEPLNICYLMADQIVRRLRGFGVTGADYVGGIPDGATKLGDAVAWLLRSKKAIMRKNDGRIEWCTSVEREHSTLILIEDFCTRATGFIEAVAAIRKTCPGIYTYPVDPVMLNRGGLGRITVDGEHLATVLAVCEKRVKDWAPEDCPLCKMGSKPIKPKATDENWRLITSSQLA